MDLGRYALTVMRGWRVPLLAGVLTLSAACGQPLGDFAVADAVRVNGGQLNAVDPIGFPDDDRGDLLQLRLLSLTNLSQAAQLVDNIYIDGWACDDPSRRIWVVGPYYDGKPPTIEGQQTVETRPDGGQTIRITGGGLRQPPRAADGRYRYTIYLALAQPVLTGHGLPSRPAYDLRAHPVDVCLRLHEVGYWLKAPTSRVVRLDRQRLQSALGRASGAEPSASRASTS